MLLIGLCLAFTDDDLRDLKIPPDVVEREDAWRGSTITTKFDYFVDDELVGERLFYRDGRLAGEKLYRDWKRHGIWHSSMDSNSN